MPSEAPRRTSPLTVLIHLLVVGSAAASMVVDSLIARVLPGFETGDAAIGGLPLPVLAVAIVSATRIVRWWFTTYELAADHLVLSTGIVRRERRMVPYARVQQVTGRRQLTDRLLGLERLTVQTAGTSDDVQLEALLRREADRVRDELERRREADAPTIDPMEALNAGLAANWRSVLPHTPHAPVAWQEVHRLSPERVALAALAAPTVWGPTLVALAVAGAGTLGLVLGDAPGESMMSTPVILLVGLAVSVQFLLASLLSRWGMVVELGLPDVVRVRSGLFEVREVRLPRRRVQWIRVSAGPIHRRLGTVDVEVHSAQALDGGAPSIVVPMVPERELAPFLTALLGEERWGGVSHRLLQPRPDSARRRAVFRRVAAISAGAALFVIVPATVFGGVAGAIAGIIVAAPFGALGLPWGRRAHERAGFAADGATAAVASGVLVYRMDTVAVDRIQSSRVTASWLSRRRGLAMIALDVAGSAPVTLRDLARRDADRLAALALPRAERVGGRS